ncbi:SNF2 family DNA or RNA helicase [Bacillus tianshenii]|uniref:SNF2 family DNA or RNA helicase n=1 Tax=Sutcliffiella tianshenii TaxID=1463404 RepID=A0ABS2NV51_9BACI|nr:DEAD/DEAH box helicase [Bacillus tianshenii]MBM7618413.1 SNF2 family DNA or RNA helicase [Bacillus tianshenii]
MINGSLSANSIYDEKTNRFFLYVQLKSSVLPPSRYIPLLFTWHEGSFFGSFFQESTFEGKTGIYLSPSDALELFANNTENSFLELVWCDQSELYRLLAPTVSSIFNQKAFIPDFSEWQKGRLSFSLTEEGKNLVGENPLLPSYTEKIEEWVGSIMMDWIKNEKTETLRSYWAEYSNSKALLSPSTPSVYLDEEDWLKDIGWLKDTTPFFVGLRLLEPEEPYSDWKLETLLKDKKTEQLYVWEQDKLPASYKKYKNEVERSFKKWQQITPSLFSNGQMREALTEEDAWRFLVDGSERLLEIGSFILLPSWWQAVKDSRLKIKARVNSSKKGSSHSTSFVGLQSLVNFEWRFSTRNTELSEEEFLALVEQNRRLVQIKGEWVVLDPQFIEEIKLMMKQAEETGIRIEDLLKSHAANHFDDMPDENGSYSMSEITYEMTGPLQNLVEQLYQGKALPDFKAPPTFKGELRPYQEQGAAWLLFLRKHGFGACLADDMGLGKTIQLIAYFLACKELEEDQVREPVLIICPTSVLGNWQKELEKFAPSLNVMLHYGTNRNKGGSFSDSIKGADVVLTSYAISHLDEEELSNVRWSTVCLDEAQNIKNADTKQSQAVRNLDGIHHIALTGTPMENRLSELWAIFDFINPGYLGSLGAFHKQFVLPIEKDQDKKKIQQLQMLIQPFLLRRTKQDEQVALNLPEKQEQKEYCPLTIEQASIYEQLVKETLEKVESLGGIQRRGLVLKMLGQLKQVCDHPSLYLKEEEPSNLLMRSTKMEKLVELVEQIRLRNESCLIFTQYISMGNMIIEAIEKALGEKGRFLNGSVVKKDRDNLITSFQNGEFHVLVLSLKAGGTGLNLTAANHVIHYDRWWNPAVENQATDRAYRIGQNRFVHVHKFIATGTLEEKIDAMIESKQALNNQIITSEGWITELSNEDLKELLTLR